MSKSVSLHRGARRRFLCRHAASPRAAAIPGNAVVAGRRQPDHEDHVQPLDGGRRAVHAAARPEPRNRSCPNRPNYTACIAHLAEATTLQAGQKPATARSSSRPSANSSTNRCSRRCSASSSPRSGCSAKPKSLGVKVTDTEVKKQFEKIKKQQFPKAAEFEKFLASSGQTVSDLLLRVKLNLLSTKIQQKIVKTEAQRHPGADRQVLQRKQVALRHPGKAHGRRSSSPRPKRRRSKAKQEIESGKSFASVAKASRSTRRARPTAA